MNLHQNAMTNWTEEQKAFQEWLALPEDMRQPKTQLELAKEIGVTAETLSRWKNLPDFYKGVEKVHIKRLQDRLGELYTALIEHAIAGKHPKYMEMAFQLAKEQFGEKKVNVTISKEEAQAMSTEQLAGRAYKLLAGAGFKSVDESTFVRQITSGAQPEFEEAKIISEDNA